MPGKYGALMCVAAICVTRFASRPHSTTSCDCAAWLARAVPQAPAPKTEIRMRVFNIGQAKV